MDITIEKLKELLLDPINGARYTLVQATYMQPYEIYLDERSSLIHCRDICYCIFSVYGLGDLIVKKVGEFLIKQLHQDLEIVYKEIMLAYRLKDNESLLLNCYAYGS